MEGKFSKEFNEQKMILWVHWLLALGPGRLFEFDKFGNHTSKTNGGPANDVGCSRVEEGLGTNALKAPKKSKRRKRGEERTRDQTQVRKTAQALSLIHI